MVQKISDSHAPTTVAVVVIICIIVVAVNATPRNAFSFLLCRCSYCSVRCALLLQVSSTQAPTRAQQYRQRRLQRVVVGVGRSINVSVLVGGPLCDVVFVVTLVGAAAVAVVCLLVSQYKYLFALFFFCTL